MIDHLHHTGIAGSGGFRHIEQCLRHFLAGSQASDPDFDVRSKRLAVQFDQPARKVDDLDRLSHVEDEHAGDLVQSGLRRCVQDELHGFGNGHEVPLNVGMGEGHRTPACDLFQEGGHY